MLKRLDYYIRLHQHIKSLGAITGILSVSAINKPFYRLDNIGCNNLICSTSASALLALPSEILTKIPERNEQTIILVCGKDIKNGGNTITNLVSRRYMIKRGTTTKTFSNKSGRLHYGQGIRHDRKTAFSGICHTYELVRGVKANSALVRFGPIIIMNTPMVNILQQLDNESGAAHGQKNIIT